MLAILVGNTGCTRERSEIFVSQNTAAIQEVSEIQDTALAQYSPVPSDEPIYEFVAVRCVIIQNVWESYGWLTEYEWYVVNPLFDMHVTPRASFRKFDIPHGAVLYQGRLRNEVFSHFYQTDDKTRLTPLYATRFRGIGFDIRFEDNYSLLVRSRGGTPWGNSVRDGEQYDLEHPLIGIWGHLPALNEYRLVESAGFVFYLDIDRRIPTFAMRAGTYLFKHVGDGVFESNSCFSDGHMRLEIVSRDLLILTPLFILPDEEGLIRPVHIVRVPPEGITENHYE